MAVMTEAKWRIIQARLRKEIVALQDEIEVREDVTETAKNVRKALKRALPQVKFSVRSSRFFASDEPNTLVLPSGLSKSMPKTRGILPGVLKNPSITLFPARLYPSKVVTPVSPLPVIPKPTGVPTLPASPVPV